MAISFVSASAVITGSNPTVAIPAGVVENDFLVIIYRGTAAPATPAGWTSRAAQGAGNFLTIFYKFAGATNASQAVTVASPTARTIMLAYRGVNATDTISTFTNAASVTTATTPTFNTTYDNEYVISIYGANNVAGTWTAPASTTNRFSIVPNLNYGGLLIVDELKTTAGATTSRTATITGAHTLSSVAFSIIPSADKYWVGGTGTWNTTSATPWSTTSGGAGGAPPPGQIESIFFDQAGAYSVTLTGALVCGNITTSGGPVTFTSTGTLANFGSMLLDANTVWNATGLITFNSTTAGKTITTNGVTINAPITFAGVNGSWNLGSALTTDAALTTTLSAGTLNLNGFDLTTGSFSSSVATTRAIAFGTNNIVLAQTTAAQTVLNMANATAFTYTGTGGFTTPATVAGTYVFGTTAGSVTNAPNLTFTDSGTATQTLTTGSWFNNLNFGTTAFNPNTTALNIAGDLVLSSGGTFTGLTPTILSTSIITSNGATLANLTINSPAGTTTFNDQPSLVTNSTVTLTAGTLNLSGFDLTTGIFNSNNANTCVIAFGSNNIILNHTTAAQTVLNMANATGFSYTGTGGFRSDAAVTRTYSFVTGGTATNAPNLTLTGSGTAVQTFATGSHFNILDFGTTAFAVPATSILPNTLVLSGSGTYTSMSVTSPTTGTITSNGKTIAAFVVNNGAGTVTLTGALGCTTYTQTAGTIDFAGFNLTCSGAVTYANGTLNNIGTITCTTFTVNGPAFNFTSGTINPSVSFVLTSGSFTLGDSATLGAVPTFTHTAGSVSIFKDYELTSTGTYTLVAGTLTLNDKTLTTSAFITTGIGIRSINFTGTYSQITLTGNAKTIWNGGGTGITYTGTPRIAANYSGSTGTRTILLGLGWTQANAFDFTTWNPGAYLASGFGINYSATDIVAVSEIVKNFNLDNFGFTVTPGALTVYGDYLIPATGGTVSASASLTTFATTSSKNISISRSIDFPITFSGVGGTFNITASLTTGATRAMTLTAGSLVLSGSSSISTGTFLSTGTGTRSIDFNDNNITLTSTVAATTVLSMADATNFTIAGTGGFVSDLGVTKTFNFGSTAGGSTAKAPNLTFTTGAAIPTITTGSWFNSLNFGSTTSSPSVTSIFVSTLTLASGGTYTGLTPTFTSTQIWTPQFSKQLAGFGVNIPDGTLTLGGSQSLIATATTTLTAGVLDLNGNDLTTGIFSSSNTNTRAIVFGSNNINLTHTTAAQIVLAMATATNFTLTDSGGGFVSNLAITRTFQFGSTAGGSKTNAPNLAITSGAAIPIITTNSWFNALDFTGTTATTQFTTVFVNTLTLATGGTYTGLTPIFTRTQTWTTQFSKELGGIGFNLAGGTLTLGDSPAIVANGTTTLTAGTLDLNGFNLGTGIFSSSNTNTRSIVFGSNSILCTSHTTTATTVLDMAIATGFTWTGTGKFFVDAAITRTAVFGTTGGTATNAPNLVVASTGTALVTLTTGSWFNDLSFSTTAFALPATTLNIAGNLTLSSGGSFTNLNVNIVGTGSIISNGKVLQALTINSVSGTTTLASALSLVATGTTTLTSGALDLNNFTLSTGIFSSSNTNTRSIAFGTGNIVLSTTTLALVNLNMAIATNFTSTSSTGGFESTMSVTRTFTFGTTGGTATNAPNLTLNSGAAIPTLTSGSWFNTLNFTGSTGIPAAATLNVNSLILAAGGTYTAVTAQMRDTGTITGNAKTLAAVSFLGGTTTLSGTLTSTGAATVNGGVFTHPVGSVLNAATFTLTTGTVNLNGGTLPTTATFNHTLGTVNITSSTALTATSTYALTAGTLTLSDGVVLSTGIFSSSNANTRSIAFGDTAAGSITLTHTIAATTRLNMAIATEFTQSGPGGFTSALGVTATFTFGTTGGNYSNAPKLSITGGAAIPTLTSGSSFDLLDFTGSTCVLAATTLYLNTLTLATGGTYTSLTPIFTRTQTWTSQFSKQLDGIGFNLPDGTLTLDNTQTYNATGSFNLIAGTLDLGGADLTVGRFISSYTNTRAIAFGTNNIILAHTTAAQTVLDMANATGFGYTGTGGFTSAMGVTRTFTFGTTGGNYINAPTLSITGGAAIPTFTTGSWFNLLNFTGSTSTPAITFLNIKSLTLASGGTYTSLSINMMDIGTITPNGKTIAAFTINHLSTTTLAGALSCTTYTQTAGTVDFSTFNLTCSGAAAFTSGTFNNTGTIACTTWTVAGPFVLSQGIISASTNFTVINSGTFTYSGGTITTPLFVHTAGTVNLNSSLTLPATSTYTLTSGTLSLTGDLTTGIFSSTNTNLRSISFGTNDIILSHTTAAQTVLNMANQTNFSCSGTGGFNSPMNVTRTFTSGTTAAVSGSVLLNGTNQYLSIPTSTQFDFESDDFTVECWIYPISFNAIDGSFMNVGAQSGGAAWIIRGTNTGLLEFTTWSSGSTVAVNITSDSGTLEFNTWNHVAVTRNSSTWNIWVNGVSVATATNVSSIGNTGRPAYIAYGFSSGAARYQNCYISNVRWVKGVSVYIGNFTVPTSPLTASQGAGTNISAVDITQTSLLLNTPNNGFFLTDGSTNNFIVTNNGAATANALTPITVLPAAGIPPNLRLTSGASVPTLTTGSNYNILDFTGSSTTPPATSLNIASALTLSSGGTYTGLTISSTGATNFTGNNKTIAALSLNNGTSTATVDTTGLVVTGAVTMPQGVLLLNGNLSSNSFATAGSSKTITGNNTTFAITNTWTYSPTGSAVFNGTTQYLTVPSNAALQLATAIPFTIEAWIYSTNMSAADHGIIGKRQTGNEWQLNIHPTFGYLNFWNGTTTYQSNITLAINTWYHVAVTWDTTTLRFFVNGVMGSTYTGFTVNSSTNQVTIGGVGLGASALFAGNISNLRMVKGVAVYTGNFTVPTGPLTSTQSANPYGGNNTSAITGTQTSLLLNTRNYYDYTTDSSTNNFIATNISGVTYSVSSPTFTTGTPGFTGTGFTINMTSATAKTFAGGGGTYPTLNQGGSGTLSITGANTFNDITNSVSGTTVTFPSGVTQTFANFNLSGSGALTGSASFNGTNQYLSIASNSTLALGSGDFTVEGFYYITQGTVPNSVLIDWRNGTNGGSVTQPLLEFQPSGSLGLNWYVNATNRISSGSAAIAFNTWQHFAISRVSGITSMYIAGNRVGSPYTDANNYPQGSIFIGRANDGVLTRYFPGYISNIRIIVGTGLYSGTTLSIPNSSLTAVTNTKLLLKTIYGAGFLTDSSSAGITVTNNGGVISSQLQPFPGLLSITASTPGNAATLYKASGIVNVSYLSIKDSNATTSSGGWYAGTNSVNVSNNTGWYFSTFNTAGFFNFLFF